MDALTTNVSPAGRFPSGTPNTRLVTARDRGPRLAAKPCHSPRTVYHPGVVVARLAAWSFGASLVRSLRCCLKAPVS